MRLSRSQIAEKVDRAMQRLGITNLAGRPPHYLSGGERKKVALAGALAMEPDILILDEPLEGLDTTVRGDIVRVIADYCSGERGVIFSTHDLSAAGLLADRVYLIGNRRIITEGPTRQVMADVSLLAQSGLEPSPLARLADVLNRGGLAVAFEPDAVRFGASVLASYAREVARWRLKDPPLRDRSREDRQ
jgi:cobalt/nickel transport system ATP-binding protein